MPCNLVPGLTSIFNRGLCALSIWLFCLLSPVSQAEESATEAVVVAAEMQRIALGTVTEYQEDKSRRRTYKQVSSTAFASAWHKHQGENLDFGYTDSAYWLRIELDNRLAEEDQQWLLVIGSLGLTDIDLYEVVDGQVLQRIHLDALQGAGKRPVDHRHYIFPLHFNLSAAKDHIEGLENNNLQKVQVYLRVEALAPVPMQLPLTLWQQSAFYENEQHNLMGMGIYYGVMLVIITYNLSLFISIRDKSYLYFILFIFFNTVLQAMLDGLGFQYLWPNDFWWTVQTTFMVMPLDFAFICLFTYEFLELKENNPRLSLWLRTLVGICCGLFVLTWVIPLNRLNLPLAITSLLTYASVLLIGFFIWSQGKKEARLFSIAWSCYLIGSAIYVLAFHGVVPRNYWTSNAAPIGLIVLVNLLSFSQANRFNRERREKQQAQKNAQLAYIAVLSAQEAESSEQEKTKLLQQLDQQKTIFFQNISHELRTPLTLILNPLDDESLKQPDNHNIKVAAKNSRRLLRLVNQVLDFQKLTAGKMKIDLAPVSIRDFIRIIGDYFSSSSESKKIDFSLSIDGTALSNEAPDLYLMANLDSLEKVVFNFLSNALKFTPEGGDIELGAVELGAKNNGHNIRIFVTDSGPGISPQNQTDLFKVFSQLDESSIREYEGSGLGLALARELTEAMGGTIGVESKEGKGSTFFCEFSSCEPPETNREHGFKVKDWLLENTAAVVYQEDIVEETLETDSDNLILVIDDLADMRRLISHRLRRQSYSVITAADGEQGFNMARQHRPNLIISDWMMPKLSGPELIKRLKSDPDYASIPVVLLTAKTDMESNLLGLDMGGDAFLGKPFNDQELISTVRNLLQLKSHEKSLEHTLNNLRITQSELIQTEKMSSLGLLLEGLARELRHPLEVAVGATADLIQKVKVMQTAFRQQSLTQQALTRFIQQSAELIRQTLFDLQQAAALVLQFKQVSVQQAGYERQLFLIIDQLGLIHPSLKSRLEQKNIKFYIECPDAMEIESYPSAIRQVLGILLENSLNYAYATGPASSDHAGQITLLVKQNNKDLILDYRDEGEGMLPSVLEHIFEPFFTTRQQPDSTGLGMYIVYNIVTQQLGGEIECSSQKGEGSRIMIKLPGVMPEGRFDVKMDGNKDD